MQPKLVAKNPGPSLERSDAGKSFRGAHSPAVAASSEGNKPDLSMVRTFESNNKYFDAPRCNEDPSFANSMTSDQIVLREEEGAPVEKANEFLGS
mmetsp:Transcript_8283/g.13858  ORF Transcript_8283/g.13858 Transcript_8283/m.13858 type:complete len:95 (+) Transcript_8283:1559-1843(+)